LLGISYRRQKHKAENKYDNSDYAHAART